MVICSGRAESTPEKLSGLTLSSHSHHRASPSLHYDDTRHYHPGSPASFIPAALVMCPCTSTANFGQENNGLGMIALFPTCSRALTILLFCSDLTMFYVLYPCYQTFCALVLELIVTKGMSTFCGRCCGIRSHVANFQVLSEQSSRSYWQGVTWRMLWAGGMAKVLN